MAANIQHRIEKVRAQVRQQLAATEQRRRERMPGSVKRHRGSLSRFTRWKGEWEMVTQKVLRLKPREDFVLTPYIERVRA